MSTTEKRELRTLFRGYTRLNKSIISTLESYGLTITQQGKHYKVVRGDGSPGCVIISKTPSDFRTGLNVCTSLIRLLEA